MSIGRLLISAGIVLIVLGLLFLLGGKALRWGHLPGDVYVRGKNTTFYFPIVTCLIVSVVLTVVLWLFRR